MTGPTVEVWIRLAARWRDTHGAHLPEVDRLRAVLDPGSPDAVTACRIVQAALTADGWTHVIDGLDAVADAVWSRDEMLTDPVTRVSLDCCDPGETCPCHYPGWRGEQPCDGCRDVLEDEIRRCCAELARLVTMFTSPAVAGVR